MAYENAIKAVDNALYNLQNSMAGMDDSSEEYRNALKSEIDLLKQKTDLVNNAAQSNNSYINSIGAMGGVGGSALGQQVVQEAEKYLGQPYKWGGTSPEGFDCSGLVQYAYKNLGIEIGRTTYDQVKEGSSVSKENLQPGDLVFFKGSGGSASAPGHVAIYAGGGQIVESPHSGASVRMANLENRSDFVGARRIVSGGQSSSSYQSNSGGYNGQYSDIINEASSKYGVPSSLIAALIKQESNFNPNAVSHAGAVGLMQLMPTLQRELGVTDPNDPYQNIMGGTQYLKQALNKTGGDARTAVGYYNTGLYGNLNNSETQNHMKKVMEYYQQYGGTEDLINTANGEIENILSKNQDYEKEKININRKIIEDYTKIYESQLKSYDNQFAHVGKNQDLAKEKYTLYKDTPSMEGEANNQAEQVWKEINWKATVLRDKENYIRSEMEKNIYDKATLQKMSLDLEQVKLDALKNVNDLHKYFEEWQNELYNNLIKQNKDNIDELQSKLDILDKSSKQHYSEKINLNNLLLAQEEEMKQKTLDRMQAVQELINKEKDPTTMQVWHNSMKQLKKDYDDISSKIIEIQQRNIELAKTQAYETIQKGIYDGKTQQEFEDGINSQIEALDNELEIMQKQNDALQERETRQKNLLSIAEAQMKLQEAQNNKNVQQLTKDKNGNWNFTYVANQQNVDSAESELRNQLKSNSDWEKQNTDKHKQEAIQNAKKNLEAEISIRNEAYSRIKDNIEKAINENSQAIINGTISISSLINTSLGQVNTRYNGKYSNIIGNLEDFIDNYTGILTDLNSKLANSLNTIENANNGTTMSTGIGHTVWVDGDKESADWKTAQKYYSNLGYEIKRIDKDNYNKATKDDILLGLAGSNYGDKTNGRKVTGVDSTETAQKAQKDALELLEKAGRESVEIEEKYSNQSTQVKQSANNRNTIIVKNATTGETMTIQKGANTNMNIIRQSWNGIVDITNDKMGNMVVIVKGKVEEASAELRNLIALQEQAGLSSGGSRSQENHVKVMPGVDPHAPTTSIYIKDGITYYYDSQHPLKFAKGGETQRTGLHWLDGNNGEPERVLSIEQTKGFNDLVFNQLPELKNIIPNLSSLISKIQFPQINLPNFDNLVNRNQPQLATSNDIHLQNLTISCPNVVDGQSFIQALKELPQTINQMANNIYNE